MADLLADNRHHQVGIYENAHLADTSHLRDKISLVLADFSLQVNFSFSFQRIEGSRVGSGRPKNNRSSGSGSVTLLLLFAKHTVKATFFSCTDGENH
jgi:hypothetical protein